jgi:hypothetical protein
MLKPMTKSSTLLLLLFPLLTCSQENKSLQQSDSALFRMCEERSYHVFSDDRKEYFDRFNQKMLDVISDEKSFLYPFDSLKRCVYISFSSDSHLKMYTYDKLKGGSAHSYTNICSYYTSSGKYKSHELHTATESPMVGYDDMIRLKTKDKNVYLFSGFGTYGGGKHHICFKIFELTKDSLIECHACYEDGSPPFFEQNRKQDFHVEFDEESQLVKIRRYRFDPIRDIYTDEYNIEIYRLENGIFIKTH